MVDTKSRRQHGGKDPRRFGNQTAEDVEFTIKKKRTAAQVERAMGQGNQSRFETPEQKWEELDEIYRLSANTLVETGQSVNQLLGVPGIQEHLEHPKETQIAITGMKNDMENFTAALLRIHALHQGKIGAVSSTEDYVLSLQVFEAYSEWNTNFQSLITPSVFEIISQLQYAYQKMAEMLQTNTESSEEAQTSTTPVEVSGESPIVSEQNNG